MVVDDEPLAVEMLAGYVRRTPSLELMSTAELGYAGMSGKYLS